MNGSEILSALNQIIAIIIAVGTLIAAGVYGWAKIKVRIEIIMESIVEIKDRLKLLEHNGSKEVKTELKEDLAQMEKRCSDHFKTIEEDIRNKL